MSAEEGLTGALRSGLWPDDEERTGGTLIADVLCCARRMDQEAEEGGWQQPLSGAGGAAARARRPVSDVRAWRVESVFITRTGWGGVGDEYRCCRISGAPLAPPARGREREGDAGGRREVGHAGMQAHGGAEWDAQPHERAQEGGTLTGVSDERRA